MCEFSVAGAGESYVKTNDTVDIRYNGVPKFVICFPIRKNEDREVRMWNTE